MTHRQAVGPLVVVGDSLLDVDLDGTAGRLSPEAPVPVVDLESQVLRPGGAALTAVLAARMGTPVVLVTALADDEAGRRLTGLLTEVEVVPLALTGNTVTKTRVHATGHPLARLDAGDGRTATDVGLPRVAEALERAGALLVADYGRGVSAVPALRRLLARRARRVPLVWDPHPRGAVPVPGAAVVTPNASEAATLAETADPDPGPALCARWHAAAIAVTVGSHGAVVSRAEGGASVAIRPAPPPAGSPVPRSLDTCGAGDQFAAAVAVALRQGSEVAAAVRAGVDAATAYVRAGAAAAFSANGNSTPTGLALPGLAGSDPYAWAQALRRAGRRLVATGGCFDLLHPGHVALLGQARQLGDALVVLLNSDASVRRLKGPDRPVLPQSDRVAMLAALTAVDAVIVFDEDTPEPTLRRLQPDVWVKGGDYTGTTLPEEATLRAHGGEVVLVPTVPGFSTTRLVSTLRRLPEPTGAKTRHGYHDPYAQEA